jgi:hypothetical protein
MRSLKASLKLFWENTAAIRGSFKWPERGSAPVRALLFVSQGRAAEGVRDAAGCVI